jgi:uncharacterized protein YggE
MSNEAVPFGTSQIIDLGYARVRASRVTFVGELGWELYIATEYATGVFDAIVAAGGDNLQVNGVTPFVLDASAATESARAVAVKNARTKANSYAKLLGVKLGKISYLVENGSPSISAPTYDLPMLAKAEASPTVIDLGQQDVIVSVTVRWAL